MATSATIELRDWVIGCKIGTYGHGDVAPDAHILDLDLAVAPQLVLIVDDNMAQVFDYDPLIARIDELARARHYATQEYLISGIARLCAAYPAIRAAKIALRKTPVLGGTGTLGVRLDLDEAALSALR
jgi:dihydroneopterin aldolase